MPVLLRLLRCGGFDLTDGSLKPGHRDVQIPPRRNNLVLTDSANHKGNTFHLLSLPPIGEGILKLSGLGFPIIPVVVVVVVNHGVYLVHYSRYLDETW